MAITALVTGASRGIGRGIALGLAKNGYDIAFTYHTKEDKAKSLKEEIIKLNQRCFYYQANLEEKEVPEKIVNQAIRDLGRLDVLVCNAGQTKFTSIRNLDTSLIDYLYQLNYRSYILATKTAANHMIEKKIKGRIIFISSTRGIRAYPNDAIYGSLKAALNRLVESLAIELAEYGITVNSIAPGAIATRNYHSKEDHISDLVPLDRRGKPLDIA
ncbi:MAG: SDR family NAD(P)-dependent oxidoreductase, partial [Candidatus Izemoplasmatales bacterium]